MSPEPSFPTSDGGPRPPIDRRRYRKVRRFFGRVVFSVFWWDIFLNRPGLRLLRRDPMPRWKRIARRYRLLAAEMGGVLIKLGQYLSTRVDLIPLEVIRELSGLQDEVPAEPTEEVVERVEEDYGRPIDQIFVSFSREPLGAASLSQVHAAQLPGGEPVVVKVLRRDIDVLVETDLKAIGTAFRWLKRWRFVAKRVDLDWLLEEFRETTLRELDTQAEAAHAERFAEQASGNRWVAVPRVYRDFLTRRTLTLENVAHIKIADHAALDAAGVDRSELARRLYRAYMEQIFIHNFVHADPHPGNLFVKPSPQDGSVGLGTRGRPFQIYFVDFGMVAEVPERLREALREFVIGLGSRDAGRVIRACAAGGLLLPGADLGQLEDALESIFDRFWGADVQRISSMVRNQVASLIKEFGQLLLETPIQVQADLTFVGRAFELLTGLTTSLDPHFNPWIETIPFAERLASDHFGRSWGERATELWVQADQLTRLPGELGRVLTQAQRGRLEVRSTFSPESRRRVERLEGTIDRLGGTLTGAALLVAGALLYEPEPIAGLSLMAAAAVTWTWVMIRRWIRR